MPLDALLRELSHPAVRDLAWVIGSPVLLEPGAERPMIDDPFCAAALGEAEPWLRTLDRAPEPLDVFLARHPSRRLGRYFERLVEFWLRHTPGLRLIAHNLPVRDGGHTLGEFDFVLDRAQWGGLQHWETVVKFYLQVDPSRGFAGYVGPAASDVLAERSAKLATQVRLSAQGAARNALGLSEALTARVFFKGYLFYPQGGARAAPAGVSPRHLAGWWCHQGKCRWPDNRRWHILPRLRWLSPCRVREGTPHALFDVASLEAILARHFGQAATPVLLAELKPDDAGWWAECARGFVVPAGWPGDAA